MTASSVSDILLLGCTREVNRLATAHAVLMCISSAQGIADESRWRLMLEINLTATIESTFLVCL